MVTKSRRATSACFKQALCATLVAIAVADISYAQMGPAEYGEAAGAGFQNLNQNVLMGLQAGREQRQLELQYRQQALFEKQAALERQRIDLTQRIVKMNDDLEKRISALLKERTGKRNANNPESGNVTFLEPKGHWPKIILPESLKITEREIIEEINKYREMIDNYAIRGDFQMAEHICLKEPDMTRFPISNWPEIYILMNQEVERYKLIVLSAFTK
jgi:hypothetical protein